MSLMRLVIAAVTVVVLSGCVVAPGPYPYGAYPAYGYAPGYVAAPAVVVGGGWGWGWRGRRW